MSQSILSEKYSKALFESVSKEQVSSVFSELDQLTKCFGEEATKLFFSNPFVSLDNKLMVAKSSLEGRCSPVVFNFLVLLVTNGRLHLLKEFVTAYQRLSNLGLGRIKADFALCQSIPRRARAPLLTKQPENPYVPRSPRFSLKLTM